MWGLLGFLGWGSFYKHKRITLGKNGAVHIIALNYDNVLAS